MSWHGQPKVIDPSCVVAGVGSSAPQAPVMLLYHFGSQQANFAETQKALGKTFWSFLFQCKCVVRLSLVAATSNMMPISSCNVGWSP